MGQTSITLAEEVKDELEDLKHEDDSWNSFFRRVIHALNDEDIDVKDDTPTEVRLADEDVERIQRTVRDTILGMK